MACGLAANYGQLVAARMAVGFGEAGGVPPSYAIITDTFPRGRRGIAFGIYNLGPPIGATLGIAFGASIAAAFDWRIAFFAIGAIGIVAALAVRLIVREPPRGALRRRPCRRSRRAPRFWRPLRMFFSRPIADARRAGQRRHPVHHLRPRQFRHPVPDAREGHDARARSRSIMRWSSPSAWARGMLVSGRVIDRFTPRWRKAAYALVPALLAARRPALLPRLRLGAVLAARPGRS